VHLSPLLRADTTLPGMYRVNTDGSAVISSRSCTDRNESSCRDRAFQSPDPDNASTVWISPPGSPAPPRDETRNDTPGRRADTVADADSTPRLLSRHT